MYVVCLYVCTYEGMHVCLPLLQHPNLHIYFSSSNTWNHHMLLTCDKINSQVPSLVTSPCAPPGEKRSGEQS